MQRMRKGNSTVKNYSYNMVGATWEAVTDVVIVALIARHLNLYQFGNYAFVMAFVAAFRVLCGISLPVIITREIAVDKESAPYVLTASLVIQAIVSTLTVIVVVLIINLIQDNRTVIVATYIAVAGVVLDFLGLLLISVARAFERMEYGAYRVIIRQTTFLAFLFLLIQMRKDGFLEIFVLFAVTHFIGMIYSAYIALSRFVKPAPTLDLGLCKYLFLEAYPIALRRFIRKVGFRIDTILLNFLKGTVETGLFHGAYKIVQGLMFVGEGLVVSVFPVLSRHYVRARDSLDELYDRSARFLAISGSFLGIILYTFSSELIIVILGIKYLEAAKVIKIFSVLIVFMFLSKLLERMLIVAKKKFVVTIIAALALVINVIFDLILIPKIGIVGASLATLLSEIVLLFLGFYYTYRFVSQTPVYLFVLKVLLVYCATCVVVTLSDSYIGQFASFICGPMFFVAGILLLGIFPALELNEIKENIVRIVRGRVQIDESQ